MIKLRPCPFCGNTNVLLRCIESEQTLWIISCAGCKCDFTVPREHNVYIFTKSGWPIRKSNHDAVVNAWNRRADNGTVC